MRKFIKKSLCLMAALLLGVGGEAWAETTTLLEYGTADVAWTTEGLATWTGKTTTIVNSSYVYYTGTDNGDFATTKTIAPTDNAIINLTAVWRGRSNTGRYWSNNCGIYFRFGNIVVAQNDQNQSHGYTFSGLASLKDDVTTFTAGSYRKDIDELPWLLIEAEINTATNTLTSFTVKAEDGSKTYVSVSDVVLSNPDYTTVAFGFQRGGSHNTSKQEQLKSVKITQTTQDVTTADYTLNYVAGGEIIKSETLTGVVDEAITLSDAQKANFTKDDVTYIYESNDASDKSIASDGSTVVTLTYHVAADWAYSVVSNLGTTITSGTVLEGNSVKFDYPQYINNDGTLYEAPRSMSGSSGYYLMNFTPTKDDDQMVITYTATSTTGVVFYTEAEDIEGITRNNENNTDIRCSGAWGGYAGSEIKLTTLEAGRYKIYGQVWGNAGTTFTLTANGNVVWEKTTVGYLDNASSYIDLTEETDIMIPVAGSKGKVLDLIYIVRYGDHIDNMSIVGDFSANGWDTTQGIAMTQTAENPLIWEAVIENYTITSSKYSYDYKAIANKAWGVYELPSSGNQNYNFEYDGAREGVYKLTFTANTVENTVELAIEKQPTATVYFVNTSDWTSVKAWVWDANNDNYNYTGGTWPGADMTATGEQVDGHDVYAWSTYELNASPTNIIISNNGSDEERTGDQPFVNGATYKADGAVTSVTKTISAAGYATYYSSYALDFSSADGLTAYVAKKSGAVITFETVTSVPANTGVLLKGAAGKYTITTTSSPAEVTSELVGVTADTSVDAGAFVLMNGEYGVGFYKTKNAFTVGANTAYLPASVSARSFIGFEEDGETTGVSEALSVKGMDTAAPVYNLQGQRVNAPQRGIFIQNGKKYIVK